LWLAALRGGGGFLAVIFVEAPTVHVRIDHFQGSAAGVDLIVMREMRVADHERLRKAFPKDF